MKNKKYFITRFIIQFAAMAAIIGLDQLFKELAKRQLEGQGVTTVIPHFIGLYYCENTGAAFSMFSSNTMVLSIVTLVAVIGALVYLAFPKKRPLLYDICIPAVIAGGAGNLIDRFARGYVVDYIATLFINFPVFNFADCFITCGCIALVIYLIYESVTEAKNKPADKKAAATEADD